MHEIILYLKVQLATTTLLVPTLTEDRLIHATSWIASSVIEINAATLKGFLSTKRSELRAVGSA